MKIWKLLAAAMMIVSLLLFVGCGQTEETTTTDTATETATDVVEEAGEVVEEAGEAVEEAAEEATEGGH